MTWICAACGHTSMTKPVHHDCRHASAVRPPGLLAVAVWADGHQEWWSTNVQGGSANFLARCDKLGREPLNCSHGMWRFDVPASDGIPPPPLPPDAALSPDAGRRWNYRDMKCPHWCTPRKEPRT